jgi:predicted chitinase
VLEKFQINSRLRLAHFLAQCSYENGGFKILQENLNYSANGLKKIFSKYFPGNLADSYERNLKKSHRGFTQTEWVMATKKARMAINSEGEVTEISKKVNGDTVGLAECIKYFKEFYALFA